MTFATILALQLAILSLWALTVVQTLELRRKACRIAVFTPLPASLLSPLSSLLPLPHTLSLTLTRSLSLLLTLCHPGRLQVPWLFQCKKLDKRCWAALKSLQRRTQKNPDLKANVERCRIGDWDKFKCIGLALRTDDKTSSSGRKPSSASLRWSSSPRREDLLKQNYEQLPEI